MDESQQKVCMFYMKVGACRHGDNCNKSHNVPTSSQTLLFPHLWDPQPIQTPEQMREYEQFYANLFGLCSQYGRLLDCVVSENQCNHLYGNVLVKFSSESEAYQAMMALRGKRFHKSVMNPILSPVINFKEARCRQHDNSNCPRSRGCNFLHLLEIPLPFKHNTESGDIQANHHEQHNTKYDNNEPPREHSYHQEYRPSGYIIGEYPPPIVPIYTSIYSQPPREVQPPFNHPR
ncbi:U2 snRNP auxiliary factor [Entamoeba marina]